MRLADALVYLFIFRSIDLFYKQVQSLLPTNAETN